MISRVSSQSTTLICYHKKVNILSDNRKYFIILRINYNFQRNILYKKDLNSTFAEENDYCMASRNLNRLKVVLAEKQRTNKWLAEQLGKDQTTISKWCTNSSQPDLGNLMQIAKILDVELTDLVRFEEFKNDGTE